MSSLCPTDRRAAERKLSAVASSRVTRAIATAPTISVTADITPRAGLIHAGTLEQRYETVLRPLEGGGEPRARRFRKPVKFAGERRYRASPVAGVAMPRGQVEVDISFNDCSRIPVVRVREEHRSDLRKHIVDHFSEKVVLRGEVGVKAAVSQSGAVHDCGDARPLRPVDTNGGSGLLEHPLARLAPYVRGRIALFSAVAAGRGWAGR